MILLKLFDESVRNKLLKLRTGWKHFIKSESLSFGGKQVAPMIVVPSRTPSPPGMFCKFVFLKGTNDPGARHCRPNYCEGHRNTPTFLPSNLKNKRLITKSCESSKMLEARKKQRRVILKSFRLPIVASEISITHQNQQWRVTCTSVCVKYNTVIYLTGARDQCRGWTCWESRIPICLVHSLHFCPFHMSTVNSQQDLKTACTAIWFFLKIRQEINISPQPLKVQQIDNNHMSITLHKAPHFCFHCVSKGS